MIPRIRYLVLALVLASVGLDHPASAEPPETTVKQQLEEVWKRDLFTGDWAGMRTSLHDRGIDIGLRLSQYGQGVASGGVNQKGEYGGRMDYRVNADLEKTFGLWKGLSFGLHAMTRFGGDISADAGDFVLPNTELLIPLPGGYNGTNITGLTITQSFFDGRAEAVFGKLDIIDLLTGFFPQMGYGQEGFFNVNVLASALPWFGAVRGLSMWGGGGWTIKNEMVQGGFLFTGTENVSTSWDFSGSFEHGVFLAGFYRFFWDLKGLPGNILIFAGGSTREQNSNDPNDIVPIPGVGLTTAPKNPWDIAAYLYQVLWQAEKDSSRKVALFIAGTGGPDNPQFAQWTFFATVEAFGPMASRPQDRMGVAGWYSGLSRKFIRDVSSPILPPADRVLLRDTWGFEIYYNVALNNWLHLTPDIQFVQNERVGDKFAIIPGIRLVMDF